MALAGGSSAGGILAPRWPSTARATAAPGGKPSDRTGRPCLHPPPCIVIGPPPVLRQLIVPTSSLRFFRKRPQRRTPAFDPTSLRGP